MATAYAGLLYLAAALMIGPINVLRGAPAGALHWGSPPWRRQEPTPWSRSFRSIDEGACVISQIGPIFSVEEHSQQSRKREVKAELYQHLRWPQTGE